MASERLLSLLARIPLRTNGNLRFTAEDCTACLSAGFLRFSKSVFGVLDAGWNVREGCCNDPPLVLSLITKMNMLEQQSIEHVNIIAIYIAIFNDIFGQYLLFLMAYMCWIIPLHFHYSSGLLIRLYYTQKNIDAH